MPSFIVNTSIICNAAYGVIRNVGAFCPTWAIETTRANLVDAYNDAGECLSDFWDLIRPVISENAYYWQTHWRPLVGAWPYAGIDDSTAVNPQGTAAGISPYFQALLVRKKTGAEPIYRAGRAYLPFIGGQWAGLLRCDPTDPDLVTAASAFASTFTKGQTTMTGVKLDTPTGNYISVGSADISPFLAFQRRRNMSHRYYKIP